MKHLAELHGGTVAAHSAGEGHGATFVVHLPLPVIRQTASPHRVSPEGTQQPHSDFHVADLGGLTILVVDDEEDASDLVRNLLMMCGARVFTASSAEEAVPMVERERPDVLVSDIGMPSVDGYELLRRVRALGDANNGRVPAIALTAFARTEDRTRALRAGYHVHLAKPVEPGELVATVANIAGRAAELT